MIIMITAKYIKCINVSRTVFNITNQVSGQTAIVGKYEQSTNTKRNILTNTTVSALNISN